MDGTRSVADGGLAEAVEAASAWVVSSWAARAEARRVVRVLARFIEFCDRGFGVTSLDGVTSSVAAEFVNAPAPGGGVASVSLRHLRRLSVRLLFRVARRDGLVVGDPTLDLVLPPRTGFSTRPLTGAEVLVCRAAAQWSLSDTRHGAAWALAEATCRTSELAAVTIGDVDLAGSQVWLGGGARLAARWGVLDEWGREQIERRLAVVGSDPAKRLVYGGADPAGAGLVSSCNLLQDVLVRAGVASESDVRASSIVGWAGQRILDETGHIDEVARRLGVRSLDRAARIIGWDWLEDATL